MEILFVEGISAYKKIGTNSLTLFRSFDQFKKSTERGARPKKDAPFTKSGQSEVKISLLAID